MIAFLKDLNARIPSRESNILLNLKVLCKVDHDPARESNKTENLTKWIEFDEFYRENVFSADFDTSVHF